MSAYAAGTLRFTWRGRVSSRRGRVMSFGIPAGHTGRRATMTHRGRWMASAATAWVICLAEPWRVDARRMGVS